MRGLAADWIDTFEIEDWLLIAATVSLPWAFGGVSVWAHRSAALLLVAAAAVGLARNGWSGLGLGRRSRWLMPAGLLALWAAVQLVPLPPPVVGLLSPRADRIYAETFPDWPSGESATASSLEHAALTRVPEFAAQPESERPTDEFEPSLGGRWSGWRPLSLLPRAGAERLHWYVALLCAFLVVRERCRDADRAGLYARALFGLFAALSVFGLVYAATSNGKLYWVRATIEPAEPFGPYVNPTNFAGVMELATPWLAGAAVAAFRSPSVRWRDQQGPALALLAVLCVVATLATGSKAAAPLLAGALVVLCLLAVRGRRARALVGIALLVLSLGAILTVRYSALGQRMEAFLDSTGGQISRVDRVVAWGAGARMFGDYWLPGTGFGAFGDVFPAYLPPGEQLRWEQAHNDYLEVAIEGGVVAVLLLVWLCWGYAARVGPVFRRTGRDYAAVGLLLGLLTLAVHASMDFNHQIPANALLFVVAAGLACAHADRQRARPTESTP